MRLAAHVTKGCKSLIRPSSGKDTTNDKGVHREVESEGSRRANLWSDEQKPHEAIVKDKAGKNRDFCRLRKGMLSIMDILKNS